MNIEIVMDDNTQQAIFVVASIAACIACVFTYHENWAIAFIIIAIVFSNRN